MSDYTREELAAELIRCAKEGRDPQTIDSSWIPMFFPEWEGGWGLTPTEENDSAAYAHQILSHFLPDLEHSEVDALLVGYGLPLADGCEQHMRPQFERCKSDGHLVIEHYRRFVGALLEHSWLDHEGTEVAIADFISSNDRAAGVLQQIRDLQKLAHEEAAE